MQVFKIYVYHVFYHTIVIAFEVVTEGNTFCDCAIICASAQMVRARMNPLISAARRPEAHAVGKGGEWAPHGVASIASIFGRRKKQSRSITDLN